MSAAHNHPSNCCCEQSHAESHALGGTAWSDSRWSAVEPTPEVDDHGRFDLVFLVKLGLAVAAVVTVARWLL